MSETGTITQENGAPLTAIAPDGATVLIVDDEPEVRTVVAEFLEELGYRVLQADGGPEALHRLDDEPDVQLLITDIRMPAMSGLELADEVAARYPHLKVIFVSGYFSAQPVSRRLLHKPFRMQDLQSAVSTELSAAAH